MPPAEVYRELVNLVQTAPKPERQDHLAPSRSGQRRALAPAVAWGWLIRTLRTGEAVIAMEDRGYGSEASPLVRAALEHAIRLQWAAEYGDEFVEVALIAQKKSYTNLQKAQTENWRFSAELADSLQQHAAEASEDYASLSNLTALRAIVDANKERLGSLYMAWLMDTQESHPSLLTARHYFETYESHHGYKLHNQSRFKSAAVLKACYALVGAIDGYAKVVGLSTYFDAPLTRIIQHLVDPEGPPTKHQP
ncbi:DUF5677 domain-containing protein [Arthrobacter sp. zg-Y411]|uniref:DUF5677 domain-containing protein n=1 Tax=Arthrobacter zhangbolii TaxID=2886936 RepID=UPI001D15DE2E|nr:DUF5677 domain-containing protein [Arthrobacter zhangbolii]MCC3294798.1 DUF5677 domain-containing protein [Arthrobacter zhangbolii]